jgi:hypothetical protein
LLGYTMGMARQYIVTPSPILPVFIVAGGTFAGVVFHGVVSFLLGELDTSWLYLIRVAMLSALYNAILTPLVYPALRRAAEGRAPGGCTGGEARMTEPRTGMRVRVLATLVVVMFAALTTRLWFLQILAAEQYREHATDNAVRP